MADPSPPVRVSVVVATNRGGPFLIEALKSVTAQTYPVAEIVVVDDGSPDPGALRAIVDPVGGSRIVRIEPSGVSAARNRGAEETTGELLAFLDDDDRWHRDRVRRHVEAMAAHSDAVASYCGMRTIDAEGGELVGADQRPAATLVDIIRGPGVMLPNLMIRRSTFDVIGGFDSAYRLGEDLDLVLKAAACGAFAFIDETLVDYRHHRSNTTRTHRALAAAIRTILTRHCVCAATAGRADLVVAFGDRLQANDRFAWWSAGRVAREAIHDRRPLVAGREMWWAVRFAPLTPARRVLSRFSRFVGGPEQR